MLREWALKQTGRPELKISVVGFLGLSGSDPKEKGS